MDNISYSIVEAHMGCMMLRVLRYNLGCVKVHAYVHEYACLAKETIHGMHGIVPPNYWRRGKE